MPYRIPRELELIQNGKIPLSDLKKHLDEQGTRILKYRYEVPRLSFLEVLDFIQPAPLADAYKKFYLEHPLFQVVPAGTKHHHWWAGGLETHCKEMIGLGFDLLELYPGDLNGRVAREDIVIAVFLHDFAKVVTYVRITAEERKKHPEKFWEKQQFKFANNGAFDSIDEESWTLLELARWGIAPTQEQWSAVLFAEGGYADANFGFRGITHAGDKAMGSNALIPFLHILDLYSSQLLGKSLIVERAAQEKPDAIVQSTDTTTKPGS